MIYEAKEFRTKNDPRNLKLKVGKSYRNRNGNIVKIVEFREGGVLFKFQDSLGNTYTEEGWFDCYWDHEIALDNGLIEEVSDSKTNPFNAGDFVNSKIAAGSTVGQPGQVTGVDGDAVFVDWGTFSSKYNYRDLVMYSHARVEDNSLNRIADPFDNEEFNNEKFEQEEQHVTEETINEFLQYLARKLQLDVRKTEQLWDSFNEEKSVKESDEFKQYLNLHQKYKQYLE